jgi:steroid 5-alpha reductase family enzyme
VSFGPLLVSLAATAGAVVILLLLTFWYAMRTRAHVIMDTVWPLGFVVILAVSLGLSAGQGNLTRRALALGLTAVWGLRLAGYVFARNYGTGERATPTPTTSGGPAGSCRGRRGRGRRSA